MVDTSWEVCSRILGDGGSDIRRVVEKRLVTMTALVEQSDLAHGHVEEFDEVLEREDEMSVQKEFIDHLDHVAELESFRESFRANVSSVRTGRASRAAIKTSSGGKHPRAFPAGVIAHATAKALAPAQCFGWCALQ